MDLSECFAGSEPQELSNNSAHAPESHKVGKKIFFM
jgi:hypothetical protein